MFRIRLSEAAALAALLALYAGSASAQHTHDMPMPMPMPASPPAVAHDHQAMHDDVITQAPEYQDGLDHIDALRLEPDRYRVCVPAPDNRRALCLLVQTGQSPPGIQVDTDQEPNGSFHRHGRPLASLPCRS